MLLILVFHAPRVLVRHENEVALSVPFDCTLGKTATFSKANRTTFKRAHPSGFPISHSLVFPSKINSRPLDHFGSQVAARLFFNNKSVELGESEPLCYCFHQQQFSEFTSDSVLRSGHCHRMHFLALVFSEVGRTRDKRPLVIGEGLFPRPSRLHLYHP